MTSATCIGYVVGSAKIMHRSPSQVMAGYIAMVIYNLLQSRLCQTIVCGLQCADSERVCSVYSCVWASCLMSPPPCNSWDSFQISLHKPLCWGKLVDGCVGMLNLFCSIGLWTLEHHFRTSTLYKLPEGNKTNPWYRPVILAKMDQDPRSMSLGISQWIWQTPQSVSPRCQSCFQCETCQRAYCSFRSVNCFSSVVISSRHSILLLSQSSSSISVHIQTWQLWQPLHTTTAFYPHPHDNPTLHFTPKLNLSAHF